MTTFNDVSILHDVVQRMKTILNSGLNISVFSSWPERKVDYPYITVKANTGPWNRMGIDSEMAEIPIIFNIDVWTKSTRERDGITGSLLNTLRTSQYGVDNIVGSGTVLDKLYDFKPGPCMDFDEPGKEGAHRKSMEVYYKYYTTT